MVVASAISIVAYFGAFGQFLAAFSPLLALVIAVVLVPAIATLTKRRTYPARPNSVVRPKLTSAELRVTHTCKVSGRDADTDVPLVNRVKIT
jgi:hypothetical protein